MPPLSQHPQCEKDVVLSLRNVRFGWTTPSVPETNGITLTLKDTPSGNLVILVGPVGCGKSTFLKGLAGETPVLEGELFVRYPDLAFCEETPWLSNSSIRSNIVGQDSSPTFDPDWYRTVLSACALDLDIKKMPARDETLVGSKGSKLSGGQRQRIVSDQLCLSPRKIGPLKQTLACIGYRTSGLCSQTYCLL
jgi:ABC-type bacteriocin/lantibiotic exporter with double-glycine peptidase domain